MSCSAEMAFGFLAVTDYLSLLYEEGYVSDQGLVKVALKVSNRNQLKEKGESLIGNKHVSGR